MDGFIAFLKTGTADIVLFVAIFVYAMFSVVFGAIKAFGGIFSIGNVMIEDAAGIRRYQPPKRPMSDNNTTPPSKEPRYR